VYTMNDNLDHVESSIRQLPPTKHVLCQGCGHETTVPILWTDWYCERCGHHNTVDDSGTPEGLVRLSLQWAGVDPESIGLALGNPHDIPADIMTQLALQLGRAPKFLGLNRKFRWDCVNCGKCCHHAITEATGHQATLSPEEASLLGVEGTHLPLDAGQEVCKFWETLLGGNEVIGTCAVHSKRPAFCRAFPLGLFGIQSGNRHVRYILWTGSKCPGLNKGRVWTVREFLKQSGILHLLMANVGLGHQSEQQ